MTPEATALRFVEAINSSRAERLAELMTDDHTFVDCDGSEHAGRAEMTEGWSRYYQMMPDFRIHVEDVLVRGHVVALFGTAKGTFAEEGTLKPKNHWHVPAAWRAETAAKRVSRWQLFVDPRPMLAITERMPNP